MNTKILGGLNLRVAYTLADLYLIFLISLSTHSLLTYFLKSKSNLTFPLYEATATRVLAGKIEKEFSKFVANHFAVLKLYLPTLFDESSKNTTSNLVFRGPKKERIVQSMQTVAKPVRFLVMLCKYFYVQRP